jgi:hypothetical protein
MTDTPAVLLGNDYLGWIETATPDTFVALLGQGTLTENRSQSSIDTSDKTTQGYNTGDYGNITLKHQLDLNINLPDAGYTRLETLANSRTVFVWQVRRGGLDGTSDDAIFAAPVKASIQSRTFPKDGVVSAKIDLSLAGAPTIDTISPA